MTTRLVVATRAGVPLEALFDASLDVDAHVTSLQHTGERAVAGVTHGALAAGDTVTWRGRHLGTTFTMTAQVTSVDRPRRFVDEQVAGPFRTFVHEHTFHDDLDGTAIMTDTVTVSSRVLGRAAERLVIVPYLRHLLRRRAAALVAAVRAAQP